MCKYFVVRLSTTKTTKILPLEKYPLYGIYTNCPHAGSVTHSVIHKLSTCRYVSLTQSYTNCPHAGTCHSLSHTQTVHMQVVSLTQSYTNCPHAGTCLSLSHTQTVHMQVRVTHRSPSVCPGSTSEAYCCPTPIPLPLMVHCTQPTQVKPLTLHQPLKVSHTIYNVQYLQCLLRTELLR